MYILPEFQQEYNDKISLGKKYLQNKKIILVGLTQNSENTISDNLDQIGELHNFCKNISCFIYENNSIDNTVTILKNYRDDQNTYNTFQFYAENIAITEKMLPRSAEKCKFFAYARNLCKNFVKTYYADYDYVIVFDPLFKTLSLDGILNSFGWLAEHYDDIDAIAGFKLNTNSDQTLSNHDDWSYRYGHWEDISKRYVMHNMFNYDPMLWFKYWIPLAGAAPIKVNSAFGGLCIYKAVKYLKGEYQNYDCDHVTFHKSIDFELTPFNLYANPSQIIIK